ncbi:MAG TPA: hypothetical protein VEX86_20920 [Longimicrobium sp.]|nr:hypothetical protein [Longimicrobium sp.]
MIPRVCCALWAALSGWAAVTAADLAALAAERSAPELLSIMAGVALLDAAACVVTGRWAVQPRGV